MKPNAAEILIVHFSLAEVMAYAAERAELQPLPGDGDAPDTEVSPYTYTVRLEVAS